MADLDLREWLEPDGCSFQAWSLGELLRLLERLG